MVLVLLACARSAEVRSEPATVDPVGTFDFQTTVDGSTVGGTITVVRTDAGFGGSISSDAGDMPIQSVIVDGMTMRIATTGGAATLGLVFSDPDTFTGDWEYAGMGGTLTGSRRAR